MLFSSCAFFLFITAASLASSLGWWGGRKRRSSRLFRHARARHTSSRPSSIPVRGQRRWLTSSRCVPDVIRSNPALPAPLVRERSPTDTQLATDRRSAICFITHKRAPTRARLSGSQSWSSSLLSSISPRNISRRCRAHPIPRRREATSVEANESRGAAAATARGPIVLSDASTRATPPALLMNEEDFFHI